MARPTKYSQELVDKSIDYLEKYLEYGDAVPSIEGLADTLGVSRSALYNWADEYPEFMYTLEAIKQRQARRLINGGLEGDFNGGIVKLMLYNHGYSEKQETAVTGEITINVDAEGFGKL